MFSFCCCCCYCRCRVHWFVTSDSSTRNTSTPRHNCEVGGNSRAVGHLAPVFASRNLSLFEVRLTDICWLPLAQTRAHISVWSAWPAWLACSPILCHTCSCSTKSLRDLPYLDVPFHIYTSSTISLRALPYPHTFYHTCACSTIPTRALPYICMFYYTSACSTIPNYCVLQIWFPLTYVQCYFCIFVKYIFCIYMKKSVCLIPRTESITRRNQ